MDAESTTILRTDGQVIRLDPAIIPEVGPEFFDPAWHLAQGSLTGSAPGRGRALFLNWKGHDIVLRPFRRGGAIGRLIHSHYVRTGASRSRAFREYDLLAWMSGKGLPVPRPVAARYAPVGPVYRAELVTMRLAETRTVADVLKEGGLPYEVWMAIGAIIAQMHRLGVDHTDLNCRNILLDGRFSPWLIDFDKCRRRVPGDWCLGNLQRLNRSLTKEQARSPGLPWTKADWNAVERGYFGKD